MTEAVTLIGGQELIHRALAGERDFAGTRLRSEEAALEELEGYPELLAYLRAQDLRAAPFIAEGADWRGLRASGLVCQAARLAGADLSAAVLRSADLCRTDLTHALLTHQRLHGADLSGARLCSADLYEANLTDAVLRNADLTGAGDPPYAAGGRSDGGTAGQRRHLSGRPARRPGAGGDARSRHRAPLPDDRRPARARPDRGHPPRPALARRARGVRA